MTLVAHWAFFFLRHIVTTFSRILRENVKLRTPSMDITCSKLISLHVLQVPFETQMHCSWVPTFVIWLGCSIFSDLSVWVHTHDLDVWNQHQTDHKLISNSLLICSNQFNCKYFYFLFVLWCDALFSYILLFIKLHTCILLLSHIQYYIDDKFKYYERRKMDTSQRHRRNKLKVKLK